MLCVTSGFSFNRTCINFQNIDSESEASQVYWDWLLRYVKLSRANAALHNVYQKDAKAVFFDLNDDGIDEILGTHFSSAKNTNGEWLLYVLQKDKNGKYKEITGEPVYFDAIHPVCIMAKKTGEYHNIQVFNELSDKSVIFVFHPEKGLYFKK